MDARVELPRVITPPIAAALHISASRIRTELRRGNWHRIARGVVLARAEDPLRADRAAAGLWLGGPSAALSGWDGARALGVGDRRPPNAPVLVLSCDRDHRTSSQLVVRRTARRYSRVRTSHEAQPYALMHVARAARCVADAALAYQSLSMVRALVTAAVQRGLCHPADLIAEYRTAPRQNSRMLRLALEDVLRGARSVAEAVAAEKLTTARIRPFQLNAEVRDGQGLMILDLYWPELRAALEVDSREYHFNESDWKATMARHNRLTALGIAVTHYPPSAIFGRSTAWIDEVRRWLAARAAEITVIN
jgi:hypothetical protein